VWLEAIIHPAALLAFQHSGLADPTRTTDRTAEVRLFSRVQWSIILAVGLAMTAFVAITYARSLAGGDEHARATVMVMLVTASASTTAVLSRLRTRAARAVVGGSLAVTAVLVQTPWLASLLHLRPLHVDDWLLAIGGGAIVPLLFGIDRARPTRRPPTTCGLRGAPVSAS
jgi:Ca2+-transporting ATPase